MLKIIKAETCLGSNNQGAELAPNAIWKNSLSNALQKNKIEYELLESPKIIKLSNKKDTSKVKNHATLTLFNRSIHDLAVASKTKQDITLLVGGDHSASIGSMFATKKSDPKTVLIYIDAHPDCNTPSSSPSGNMHGMSLATVLGDSLYEDYKLSKYKYSEVIILGTKDIDACEQKYIQDKKIRMYTVSNIITSGIGQVMKEVLEFTQGLPVHISLDIDSIDVSEAPGTGIVNKGGLTYREIRYITELLGKENIRSIDLMEVNPKNDKGNKTLELSTELILNLLGGKWSPYEKYLSLHA